MSAQPRRLRRAAHAEHRPPVSRRSAIHQRLRCNAGLLAQPGDLSHGAFALGPWYPGLPPVRFPADDGGRVLRPQREAVSGGTAHVFGDIASCWQSRIIGAAYWPFSVRINCRAQIELIAEHSRGLGERNPVFSKIEGRFTRVPLKLHAPSVTVARRPCDQKAE